MSVIDERTVVADYDVVIINRGSKHGLEPGHVLEVWEAGEQILDTTRNPKSRRVQLPDERNGVALIFKAYDRMSYGLDVAVGPRGQGRRRGPLARRRRLTDHLIVPEDAGLVPAFSFAAITIALARDRQRAGSGGITRAPP